MPTLESARAAEAAFLEDVCRHPGDDAPRLIYADWLDEHGQAERAEFIRVQCELAGFYPTAKDWGRKGTAERYEALRRREWELLGRTAAMTTRQVFEPEYGWLPEPVRYLFETGSRDGRHDRFWEWRRGFVEEVTLTAEAFLAHAAALFRASPVRRVTLAGKEPSETVNSRWMWCARRGPDLWLEEPSDLPPGLFDLLPDTVPHDSWRWTRRPYESRVAALTALGHVCLLYGRRAAWPCPSCGGTGRPNRHPFDPDLTCPACGVTGHTVEEG